MDPNRHEQRRRSTIIEGMARTGIILDVRLQEEVK
jgi:hypothetical protein